MFLLHQHAKDPTVSYSVCEEVLIFFPLCRLPCTTIEGRIQVCFPDSENALHREDIGETLNSTCCHAGNLSRRRSAEVSRVSQQFYSSSSTQKNLVLWTGVKCHFGFPMPSFKSRTLFLYFLWKCLTHQFIVISCIPPIRGPYIPRELMSSP